MNNVCSLFRFRLDLALEVLPNPILNSGKMHELLPCTYPIYADRKL